MSLYRRRGMTFASLTTSFLVLNAFAAPARAGDPLSGEAIFRLIQERGVTSVDELMPLLPEEMRSRFSLVTQTRNLVQAASYETPRIVLFSEDGKFLITMAGSANVTGGSTIEMLTQQPDGRWQPMSGQFENGRFSPDRHPTACQSCHGKEIRPIWDGYPRWPGVYGSSHGFLRQTPGERIEVGEVRAHRVSGSTLHHRTDLEDRLFRERSLEHRELQAFMKTRANSDRFRHLIGLKEANYHALAELNSELSTVLTRRTHQQIIQRLMERPEFSQVAAWLLKHLGIQSGEFRFNPAEFDSLPPEIARRARDAYARLEPVRQAQIERHTQQVTDRLQTLDPDLYIARNQAGVGTRSEFLPNHVGLIDQRAFTMIEAVGEALGVERSFWEPGLLGTVRQAGGGLTPYAEFFSELAEEIGRRDPNFARHIMISGKGDSRFVRVSPEAYTHLEREGYRLPPPPFDCRGGYANLANGAK